MAARNFLGAVSDCLGEMTPNQSLLGHEPAQSDTALWQFKSLSGLDLCLKETMCGKPASRKLAREKRHTQRAARNFLAPASDCLGEITPNQSMLGYGPAQSDTAFVADQKLVRARPAS